MATRIYTPLQSGLNTVLSKGESLIPITPTRKSHRNLFTTFELSQADRQTTDRKISTLSWIIKIKYMRLLRDNWPTVGDGDFYAFLWKVVRFRCDSWACRKPTGAQWKKAIVWHHSARTMHFLCEVRRWSRRPPSTCVEVVVKPNNLRDALSVPRTHKSRVPDV